MTADTAPPRGSRRTSEIPVVLSTASVFPERTADAFELAGRLGYDGIEVMVTADPVSQDAAILRKLSDYHAIPVVAVHAPNLLITQRVWGRDPWTKLEKSRDLAAALGARVVGSEVAKDCLRTFLATEFEGGRHARRVAKLS